MSKSLLLLFKKERCEWFAFLLSKIERFNRKNLYFSYVFKSFSLLFPFLCPRANGYCRSLVCRLFLKSNRSDSLSSLFTKEQPWAIHSHSFLQKSNCERFAPVALYKRATVAIRWFPRANRYSALSLTENNWFDQKTKERIPNPGLYWYSS